MELNEQRYWQALRELLDRAVADEAAERAHARLAEIDGDTDVLAGIVDGLASRTV